MSDSFDWAREDKAMLATLDSSSKTIYVVCFTGRGIKPLYRDIKTGARGMGNGRLLRAAKFHMRNEGRCLDGRSWVSLYDGGYRKCEVFRDTGGSQPLQETGIKFMLGGTNV